MRRDIRRTTVPYYHQLAQLHSTGFDGISVIGSGDSFGDYVFQSFRDAQAVGSYLLPYRYLYLPLSWRCAGAISGVIDNILVADCDSTHSTSPGYWFKSLYQLSFYSISNNLVIFILAEYPYYSHVLCGRSHACRLSPDLRLSTCFQGVACFLGSLFQANCLVFRIFQL